MSRASRPPPPISGPQGPPPPPPKSFRRELGRALDGEVRFDGVTRGMYATDASVYQIFPAGVVLPRNRRDVARTLEICGRHGISITPRGGGTSAAGQAVGSGIQLDFSRYMRGVLEVDPEGGTVRVEPGVVVAELNRTLKPHGLHLPLDLSTANRATLGGMIANNSSGTRSIVYGTTLDYVEALTVLLSDGSQVEMKAVGPGDLERKCRQEDLEGRCYREVRRLARELAPQIQARYPALRRRVGGYNLDAFLPGGPPFDLSRLLVGSEGTLGLVLDATLRVVPPPGAAVLGVAQFQDLRDALKAVAPILEHGPSAVELMDRKLLSMTEGKPHFQSLRSFVAGDPGALLMVEFMGDSVPELLPRLNELETRLKGLGLSAPLHRALDPEDQHRIWELRRAGLGLAMAQVGDTKAHSFVEDTAVAPEQLPEYIARFQEILRRHDTEALFYAHASVGLLHIRPGVNLKTPGGRERFRAISEEVAELVLEMGGALSGEHGDGMVRSPFQERIFGPELYGAFCSLKDTFDPRGLLNPGKIVRAEALDANLRFPPAYETRELATTFDFSDFEGVSRAAEQCAGVGACRKTSSGSMCPSYMATLEEGDSTRGRANALRLAISGQLGPGGLTDPALYPVMDLCLECKACKTECPTGVDMARLKSEFLDQHRKAHGASLRTRLLASAERAAVWGSRLAPFSNWVLGNPLAAWLGERFLGIDARRRLPRAVRKTFIRWWKGRGAGAGVDGAVAVRAAVAQAGPGDAGTPRVAIFADTFTNHYEPRQGMAAVRVAEGLGVRVEVPERVCCGRPLISKGFLARARTQAEATVRTLFPLAREGVPVVFCEPGCFSAVKDDHSLLLRGELREMAQEVAAACLTFEEWALGVLKAGTSSGAGAAEWPSEGAVSRDGTSAGLEAGGAGRIPGLPRLSAGPKRILLHGHCHQKALTGMDPALELLGRIPGCEVVDPDAPCCGMAGSFGYEKEHYEVSRAVAEVRLLDAIRTSGADTVVAPGFSCRQQIRHFTDAEPVTVMELLERLILEENS